MGSAPVSTVLDKFNQTLETDRLNDVVYNKVKYRLFVTGKNWDTLC